MKKSKCSQCGEKLEKCLLGVCKLTFNDLIKNIDVFIGIFCLKRGKASEGFHDTVPNDS
jgi:hypothetical protein